MVDLFNVSWSELDVADVEAFLRQADEEGVTWEAKADHDGSPLRPASIQKAACGFANQIGGYLLIGAKRSAAQGWELPGISPPSGEPGLWLSQVIRGLQPVPGYEVKTWQRPGQKIAAAVRIEPVGVAPCMTPSGVVYERVSGETLPVKDPVLLDRLFRRGRQARESAEARSLNAAKRAEAVNGWTAHRCATLSVGISPFGRETDDISRLLFTKATREAVVKAGWDLLLSLRPEGRPYAEQRQHQDSHAVVLEFTESNEYGVDDELLRVHRSTWVTQANWDGSVGASLALGDGDVGRSPPAERILTALSSAVVSLVPRLGGYGPAALTVVVDVTQRSFTGGRRPPEDTMFAMLGEQTLITRLVDSSPLDRSTVASIGRELRRAAGEIHDEPTGYIGPPAETP